MTLPLSGIKVVDLCTVYAGPFAAMLLADQGAEVIKLEPPEGATSRTRPPFDPGAPGLHLAFLTFNRNKRSIVADITKPLGRKVAHDLVRWADVLVINMRLHARQRRGFTYQELAAVNPKLIYASITGYGAQGPDANLPGADITIQARVGDLAARRYPGGPMPHHTSLFSFDMATSMLTAYAVMLALWERERTGQGKRIELNLLQSALACQAVQRTQLKGSDERVRILPTGLPIQYLCSDGRYLLSQSISAERLDNFCRAVGLDYVVEDPRYDSPQKREQRWEELVEILGQHLLSKPAAAWEAMLKTKEVTASVLKEFSEVVDDPQVVANHMITQFDQPGFGTVTAIAPPFNMDGNSDEPWLRRPVPVLGEHTHEVLRELGYELKEIDALKAAKVIG